MRIRLYNNHGRVCGVRGGTAARRYPDRFEQNEALLVGPEGSTVAGTQESDFSSTPVLKILSPIKLGWLNQPIPVDLGTDAERKACFGFGARFSGSQKRLEGRWFNLDADPTAKPNYNFRSDQIAGEVLFGQLSEVSLAVGLGSRAGLNNYDLVVTDNDLILFEQRNKFRGFASWAFYLDLQVLLAWPFLVFEWPLSPVFLFYSYCADLRWRKFLQRSRYQRHG